MDCTCSNPCRSCWREHQDLEGPARVLQASCTSNKSSSGTSPHTEAACLASVDLSAADSRTGAVVVHRPPASQGGKCPPPDAAQSAIGCIPEAGRARDRCSHGHRLQHDDVASLPNLNEEQAGSLTIHGMHCMGHALYCACHGYRDAGRGPAITINSRSLAPR